MAGEGLWSAYYTCDRAGEYMVVLHVFPSHMIPSPCLQLPPDSVSTASGSLGTAGGSIIVIKGRNLGLSQSAVSVSVAAGVAVMAVGGVQLHVAVYAFCSCVRAHVGAMHV